jgi:inosose dehydratase
MSAGARIAGAPISWGVCEAPGWGLQLAADEVLDELRDCGYVATEAGPDDLLAADPDALRAQLGARGLELAGAFIPVVLHDADARERSYAQLDAALERLEAFPSAVACLAVLGDRADYEAREVLGDDDWSSVLAGLDALATRAAARGVTCVVHPHVGTVIERGEDVDRVLDGSSIKLCLDTGHLLLGGIDPVELVRRSASRIAHVHLKDVDAAIAERWRSRAEPSYHANVAAGMYVGLGDGDAHVGDVIDELVRRGYDGWFVLERDTVLDADIGATGMDAHVRVASATADRVWVEERIAAATHAAKHAASHATGSRR